MAVATLLLLAAATPAEVGMDLSGKWRLNKDLSDDPREVMRAQMAKMEGRRGGGAGGGGMRGGGPPGGGAPGGGRPPMSRDEMEARGERLERARQSIEIINGDTGIIMVYATGDTVTVIPDGVERATKTILGEERTTAYWDEFELVVVVEPSDRPPQRRRYRINDDGRLEIVTLVNLPMLEKPVEIVAVYDEVR